MYPKKTLLSLALLTAAVAANAERYEVHGELVGVENSRGSQQAFPKDSTPDFEGEWDIDTEAKNISGNFEMGSYIVETSVKVFGTQRGTVTLTDVEHQFGGDGQWDAQTRTFSYLVPAGGSNAGGASKASGEGKCEGSGLVCGGFEGSNADWEGLAIELVFSEDGSGFTGSAQSVERSGSGFTKSSTVQRYKFSGKLAAQKPLPAQTVTIAQ